MATSFRLAATGLPTPARTQVESTRAHLVLDGVLDAGGRHYLAKDFQTSPAAVRRGYPRLDEWLAIRARVDPAGVWSSDLSRRLGLTPTTN